MLIASESYAQKLAPLTAEFPKEMAPAIQAEYAKLWEKGKVLYQLNCAQCHNVKKKRLYYIPDFTAEQLKGYEIRVSNPRHESEIPEERVSPEDLVMISTFLQYKSKSGINPPGVK